MITDDVYNDYLAFLLAGNRQECARMINDLIRNNITIKELYIHLFQRSMYEVGTLWEHNGISVSTEHMCTAMTESLMNLSYPLLFSAVHSGKKAVISCTPNEYHQIGARMVADYFELFGWDGYFLGADTPSDELIHFLHEKKPDLVALSMSVSFNIAELHQMAVNIRQQFPDLPIIAGGQGFRWGGDHSLDDIDNVMIIHSLDDLAIRYLIPSDHES